MGVTQQLLVKIQAQRLSLRLTSLQVCKDAPRAETTTGSPLAPACHGPQVPFPVSSVLYSENSTPTWPMLP